LNVQPLANALLKCQELLPSLDLDLEEIDEENLAIRPISFYQWHSVILSSLALIDFLKEDFGTLPDIEPYTYMNDTLEDLEALILSLNVFYECTLKTYRIEPR
jgi:hypothetical protein